MSSTKPAVVADGLRKRFGKTEALRGFDLAIPEGSVLGLLGPNGAGKTTSVRILSTLLRFDAGRAFVAGFDVARQAPQVRRRIGLLGQEPAVDEVLTGRQNLEMFGRLYHTGARTARSRAGELLDQFGLSDAADRPAKQYSGGMRRRLDLAVSLILAPAVLFLDEPTSGLDPRGRNEMWDAVRSLVGGGTTVLLTTQYLDEADQLSDQISVMESGKVIANGTPDELKSMIGGDQVNVILRNAQDLSAATAAISRVTGTEPEVDPDTRKVSAPVRDRAAGLTDVIRMLDSARIEVEDVGLRRPTLDEVFLRLTGHTAKKPEDPGTQSGKQKKKEVPA